MTREQALEKIQKLLKLTQSTNENEAQSAMLMAQKLMAQYKIEMSAVEDTEDHKVVEEKVGKPHRTAWKRQLAKLIATNFLCDTYIEGYRTYTTIFIGKQDSVKVCKQVYLAAVKFIDFNFAKYWNTEGKYQLPREAKWLGWTELPVSHSIAQKSSYANGFMNRLQSRFEEQKVKADKEGWGLILVKDKDVEEYKEKLNLRKSRFSSSLQTNSSAYFQGYEDCGSKFGDTGVEKIQ